MRHSVIDWSNFWLDSECGMKLPKKNYDEIYVWVSVLFLPICHLHSVKSTALIVFFINKSVRIIVISTACQKQWQIVHSRREKNHQTWMIYWAHSFHSDELSSENRLKGEKTNWILLINELITLKCPKTHKSSSTSLRIKSNNFNLFGVAAPMLFFHSHIIHGWENRFSYRNRLSCMHATDTWWGWLAI